jgi:dihydrofolate reductase
VSQVRSHIAISLDGFVAGPNQSLENPIGEGGMRLHQWMFETDTWLRQEGGGGGVHNADSEVLDEVATNVGAYIMGRKMFGGGAGPWDTSWVGWWGDEPPYHVPVFVLTHHPREPLTMRGGTTFNFVTDGFQSALDVARSAAGAGDVVVAGGASTIRQYLGAGLLDELYLHIVPVLLGAGERLLQDVGDPVLEPVEVVHSPAVTHIKYRISHEPRAAVPTGSTTTAPSRRSGRAS